MLSVGICSPHDPQFISGPPFMIGATLPKALPKNASLTHPFRESMTPRKHIFIRMY